MKNENEKLPKVIGVATVGIEKPMISWRRKNRRVAWSQFVRDCVAVAYPEVGKSNN